MNTIFTILIFIIIYSLMSRFIGVLVLNIVGLPGAIIGKNSKSKTEAKYILGAIICAFAHVYVYLSFVIYLITWTKTRVDSTSFSKYIIWFFCMVAAIGSIQQIYYTAKKEESDFSNNSINPQIFSLLITEIVTFFCFFLFLFYPVTINPFWTWVLRIGYPF